jgi:hypothetical protein
MLNTNLLTKESASRPKRLDLKSFPNEPNGAGGPPTMIANIEHLLQGGGFSCQYDVIQKRHRIFSKDGCDASMNEVMSYAVLHQMQQSLVYPFVLEVAERNPVNPVAAWIKSREWDGVDRLPALYAPSTPKKATPKS